MALLAPMGSAPLAQLRPAFQETQVKGELWLVDVEYSRVEGGERQTP